MNDMKVYIVKYIYVFFNNMAYRNFHVNIYSSSYF